MKKFLAGFAIVAISFLAIASAESLVPHSHEKQSHHSSESSEKNCPICQITAHHINLGTAPLVRPVTINFLIVFFVLALVQIFYFNSRSTVSLRAPPRIF